MKVNAAYTKKTTGQDDTEYYYSELMNSYINFMVEI